MSVRTLRTVPLRPAKSCRDGAGSSGKSFGSAFSARLRIVRPETVNVRGMAVEADNGEEGGRAADAELAADAKAVTEASSEPGQQVSVESTITLPLSPRGTPTHIPAPGSEAAAHPLAAPW
ncbi:hypothetical protein ACFCWD_15290 [Streptomyces sp. NPDC056374]|uniref:hypothetical protein n=1 Tax=unclassified Streptomyces TaxID=2593676 RepID=UPI0035E22082